MPTIMRKPPNSFCKTAVSIAVARNAAATVAASPAITAGTATRLSIKPFLKCPASAAAEQGRKYRRFIPCAAVCATPAKVVR